MYFPVCAVEFPQDAGLCRRAEDVFLAAIVDQDALEDFVEVEAFRRGRGAKYHLSLPVSASMASVELAKSVAPLPEPRLSAHPQVWLARCPSK